MSDNKAEPENVTRIVEVKTKEDSDNSSDAIVRLTPTGKISHAKTRVYTQRYRKEWEHMADFKDWLTSVPYQATRAFCKFCERNLHAHRLSLLKHMCTLKHQRAAIDYDKKQASISIQQAHETLCDINYVVEKLDTDDDDQNENYVNCNDTNFVQEDIDEVSVEHEMQEVVEESEDDVQAPTFKKIRLQKDQKHDTLAEAMVHVQEDYLAESEPIQLEMIVHSDHEEDVKSYGVIKYETLENSKDEIESKKVIAKKIKHQSEDNSQKTLNNDDEASVPESNDTENQKKIYYFSSNGKSYTLVKSKLPHLVLNQLNDKSFTISKSTKSVLKNNTDSTEVIDTTASTSQDTSNKNVVLLNPSTSVKPTMLKKSIISTHVLETSKGIPVSGLQVSLYKLHDGRWTFIYESMTTINGNCNDFSNNTKTNFSTGRYKLHYDVEKYYTMRKVSTIYPFIEIVFDIKDPNVSYHIPLLLSPFSYSTYKNSRR